MNKERMQKVNDLILDLDDKERDCKRHINHLNYSIKVNTLLVLMNITLIFGVTFMFFVWLMQNSIFAFFINIFNILLIVWGFRLLFGNIDDIKEFIKMKRYTIITLFETKALKNVFNYKREVMLEEQKEDFNLAISEMKKSVEPVKSVKKKIIKKTTKKKSKAGRPKGSKNKK